MAEPGSFRAAALLNSTAGVQRVVCVCMANGIFNNPWKGIHTYSHTKEKKHTHTHPRAPGLTFSLSSIVPSAWLTLTSEAAGLITSWGGGNERNSWREEEWGPGEEEEDQEERGRSLMLRRAPPYKSPSSPTHLLHSCVWTEFEICQPDSTDTVSQVWWPK